MTGAFPVLLFYKNHIQFRVLLLHIILDFFIKVSDDKNKFGNSDRSQLVYDERNNRLPSHRYEGFGLCISERAESGTGAGYGNYCFHILNSIEPLKYEN